jgi:hypothetical protein
MKETKNISLPPSNGPKSLALSVTWSTLAYYVTGSVFFIAGALGFLLSIYLVETWLVPFQFGAITWIIGCVAYMIPLLAMFCKDDFSWWPWGLGEVGYVVCLSCFIVGCAIVFFGPPRGLAQEDQVLLFLPAMNGLFLAGSACLFLNPVFLLLSGKAKPWICSPSQFSSEVKVTTVDWWFEAAVAFSFTFAGAAGGYGDHPNSITAGLFFWIIGSVVLFAQAMLLIFIKLKSGESVEGKSNPAARTFSKRSTEMSNDDEVNSTEQKNDDV